MTDRLIRRQEQLSGRTVAALLDWCQQNNQNPQEVTISGGHLSWLATETEVERERRETFEAFNDEYERTTYQRLKAKFE